MRTKTLRSRPKTLRSRQTVDAVDVPKRRTGEAESELGTRREGEAEG